MAPRPSVAFVTSIMLAGGLLVPPASAGNLFGLGGADAPAARSGSAATPPAARYIVLFRDGQGDADAVASALAARHGLTAVAKFRDALRGAVVDASADKVAALRQDPAVASVFEDRLVRADATAYPYGVSFPFPKQPSQIVPTGVSRVGGGTTTAVGVTVAVLDTGIDLLHPDLAGSLAAQKDCVGGRTADDDNGHGTHVAGIIAAGRNGIGTVGVAPEVKIAAVKVLNSWGYGTWSSVLCGIDWVTANAKRLNIKVANMSLGGYGTSDGDCGRTDGDPFHQAICRARDAGVTFVVAAGNEESDVRFHAPASYDDAVITVSALADSDGRAGGLGARTGHGMDDTFAAFSNFGAGVDLGAPGVDIRSTWPRAGYMTASGTSMATPHVAAAAALYAAAHPTATFTEIRDALVAAAEKSGAGHTDPGGRHPEPVLRVTAF